MNNQKNYKTVLIGKSFVGKTSLITRLQTNTFENQSTTIGASYVVHNIVVDGKDTVISVWDTSGQDKFNNILPLYVKGAKICLLCTNTNDIPYLRQKLANIRNIEPEIKVVIVVTMVDKIVYVSLMREHFGEIVDFTHVNNLELYFTSSLTGEGVTDLFENVARYTNSLPNEKSEFVNIDLSDEIKKKSCAC